MIIAASTRSFLCFVRRRFNRGREVMNKQAGIRHETRRTTEEKGALLRAGRPEGRRSGFRKKFRLFGQVRTARLCDWADFGQKKSERERVVDFGPLLHTFQPKGACLPAAALVVDRRPGRELAPVVGYAYSRREFRLSQFTAACWLQTGLKACCSSRFLPTAVRCSSSRWGSLLSACC